jgi:6-phosphogluconolactonase (cycloisomerase 2 family)
MTMKLRVLLILLLALVTMWMAGCGHYTCGQTFGSASCGSSGTGITSGGGTVGTSGTAFIYFMDDKAGEIAADYLDLNGSQTFLPVPNFVTPTLPLVSSDGGMVVVKQTYLYVALPNNTVYGYSIDGTAGALTAVPNSPYTVDAGASMVADPAGRFLFVASDTGISVFAVSTTDGSLTLTAGSPFSTGGARPAQMVTDGTGKYLYAVQGFPGSEVVAFSYDQTTGALTPIQGSPFAFNMAEISGESSGKYLVGITQVIGVDSIYVFSITQTGSTAGAITLVAGSPFATISSPINLTVDPNGEFIYTFNEDSLGNLDPVEGYAINSSTGALTALQSSPFTSLKANMGSFDQSGEFMAAIATTVGTSTGTGVFPYAADSSTGNLSDSLTPAFYPNHGSYAFTDAP